MAGAQTAILHHEDKGYMTEQKDRRNLNPRWLLSHHATLQPQNSFYVGEK